MYCKAMDLLRLNTLRDTTTAFLTSKRYDKQPRPFYMECPYGPIILTRPQSPQANAGKYK